ncbi:MAG: NAD-glutamate dehydrogenase [Steroidobacteraceae bacterium]|nr:NAD-glutamate dehydrogenase [Steroidobacteraceae bacterium]
MKDTVPAARLALIERIVKAASARGGARRRAIDVDFCRAFFHGVAEEDLRARPPEELAGMALSHFALGRSRAGSRARVRVFNPDPARDGFQSRHTVVQIIADDMPFLVDSVSIVFAKLQIAMHLIIHPVIAMRRDSRGRALGIGADAGADTRSESWQLYEVDRRNDAQSLAALEAAIRASLVDVQAAVEDWMPIRDRVRTLAAGLAESTPLPAGEISEARALLEWMEAQHFVFLGYRRYRLVRGAAEDRLVPVPSSGLGILRRGHGGRRSSAVRLRGELRQRARDPELLILTKANTLATVHRGTYLDYVGVKTFDARGRVDGEHRILGLWTSTVYYRSARAIPVLRHKVESVIDHFGLAPQSHDAKAVVNVLETYPRDELFQASVPDLIRIVREVVNLYERRTVRLLARRDPYGRFYSCLVYVPRDRYSTDVRHQIERILLEGFHGEAFESQVQISDSRHARVHVVVRIDRDGRARPDIARLEREIAAAATNWLDRLSVALKSRYDEAAALALIARYAAAFPAAYEEEVAPADMLEDIADLELLRGDPAGLRLNLHRPAAQVATRVHLKFVKLGETIPISDMLPLLENFGLRVITERPYELAWPDGGQAWIQDFELEHRDGLAIDIARLEPLFNEAVAATWRGAVENDGFNRLVLLADMPARDVIIARLIAKYLLQTGVPFSQATMERALARHADIARELIALFHARFDPAVPARARARAADRRVRSIGRALTQVTSLDEDRILRAYLAVMRATLRTNYYQLDAAGRPKDYVSLKLDPAKVPDLPLPRPKYEIFVYSPRVEGVHLRMAAVARGGIRWSDRRDDFRTEVLGLMKAQNVKNTVIVPAGAKGGFVPKQLPAGGSRDDIQREAVATYRIFISGLLDVTDNIVGADVVPPPRVVRHDGDDPYLVVAADKGTATFSDIANSISVDYGFWLGDAFASGGSAGYDHKKMGITARGAWESVRRHLREIGIDSQAQDFTVAGIGDMAGDVFGNGMLLSKHIRLLAAFNHMHVFIDPDPDAARSFGERQRLFRMPRSGWDDYDRKLISRGGGVFLRSAKSIPLSPEARRVLGLEAPAATPQEVIRAILRMQVDLLWNGGIGTYVKASNERHAEVGDRSNDSVRVDGRELRARIVGEGGNLGCTQRGRIEYAMNGGRINTDFIDNSAGVNTSDVEVNIKILLSAPERSGRLARAARNRLLAGMTGDVSALVLRNNYLQSQALSVLHLNTAARLSEYRGLIRSLERAGDLDRAIEFLPGEDEFIERAKRGAGLTRPELAVVLAYSKIWLSGELIDSDVPEDPYLSEELRRYFPEALRRRFARDIEQHRLRREIIVTATTNSLVNRMGPVFAWRAIDETGASIGQIARAYTIARETFDMRDSWRDIEALDGKVPAAAQYAAYDYTARLLRHMSYWLLHYRRRNLHVERTVAEFRPGVRELGSALGEVATGLVPVHNAERRAGLVAAGLPEDLAGRIGALESMEPVFDLVELAAEYRRSVRDAARIYYAIGAAVGLDWLRTQIGMLPVSGPWQASARSALRNSAARAHRKLAGNVLRSMRKRGAARDPVAAWIATQGDEHAQWARMLTDMRATEHPDFATLSVGVEAIRKLAAG